MQPENVWVGFPKERDRHRLCHRNKKFPVPRDIANQIIIIYNFTISLLLLHTSYLERVSSSHDSGLTSHLDVLLCYKQMQPKLHWHLLMLTSTRGIMSPYSVTHPMIPPWTSPSPGLSMGFFWTWTNQTDPTIVWMG